MEIISMILLFAPLLLVLFWANWAQLERERGKDARGLTAVTYLTLIFLYALLIGLGLTLQLVGRALTGGNLPPDLLQIYTSMGIDGATIESMAASLPSVGLGLWLPSLLGLILLLPGVRRLVARIIPIDPASPVHAVALALSMLVLTNMLVTLGIGLGTLAETASMTEQNTGSLLAQLWAQQLLTALLAVVGVGWLRRRNGRSLWQRLGITGINGRQLLIGVGVGLALVPVVILLETASSAAGWDASDVEKLTEALLGPLFTSIPGILTLGLAAAIGEETLFRGALQPRFGLPLTALLFALLHSTYGLSIATVVVFILGYILGWLRNRYSTSTSMVVHAIYNMTLGVISYLSVGGS
ncbi:MAG: CPBP family intramembrane metalloprotease [Anaerolineales bacterium]|nr:CPBP family intramembrane metalloprotease [Anaerolineales bacterium]